MKSEGEIFPGVEVVAAQPALYIRALDAVVVADLHLGYEEVQAEMGAFVPKVQYQKILAALHSVTQARAASTIIINGDIKHEFSETSYHEYKELLDFFNHLSRIYHRVIVIKGNHDNYIIRVTARVGAELREELCLSDYFFTHGHKLPGSSKGWSTLIVAHEHPTIGLIDELGSKEKVKCFLYGKIEALTNETKKFEGKRLVVLPALSYFSLGSDVNLTPQHELLTPLLQNINLDSLNVLGLLEGERTLLFPKLGQLKRLI